MRQENSVIIYRPLRKQQHPPRTLYTMPRPNKNKSNAPQKGVSLYSSCPETPREKADRYPSQPLPNQKGMLLWDNLEPLPLPENSVRYGSNEKLFKLQSWDLKITHLERKMIFHTSMFSFRRLYISILWLINQPPTLGYPLRNKGLIRPYQGKPMVDKTLMRPYFQAGTLGG